MLSKEVLDFKNIKDDYSRALQLVSYLFRDKTDKAGVPYIDHLIAVSNFLDSPNTKIAGLLHDVVEDIEGFTLEDLKKLGFSDHIVEIVRIVTKDKTKNQSYHDWITDIIEIGNVDALKVKYADIMDHLSLERLDKLDQIKRSYFINKYKDEATRLAKALMNV